VYLHQYQAFEKAQGRLQMFLEDVYNAERLHSSLDYVPPDEFELKYAICSCLSGLDFLGALQIDKLSKELSIHLFHSYGNPLKQVEKAMQRHY
jgi:hypothetical protein